MQNSVKLFNDVTYMLRGFLENAIKNRELETFIGNYHLFFNVVDIIDKRNIIVTNLYIDEGEFVIAINFKEKSINMVSFENDENRIDTLTSFGSVFDNILLVMFENELNKIKEYFEEISNYYFDNIKIKDYDIKFSNECYKHKGEDGEVREIKKRYIKEKRKRKEISVDRGLGEVLRVLNNNKNITTTFSCCGHGHNHISLYCLEENKNYIKKMISEHMMVSESEVLEIDDDDIWMNLKDGRKYYTFSWNCEYEDGNSDSRQSMFDSFHSALKKTFGDKELIAASTDNVFHASNINLGWLMNNIVELNVRGEIKTTNDIVDFIDSSVQRMKDISIKTNKLDNDEGYGIDIEFSTKDDFGYYTYNFSMPLKDIVDNFGKSLDEV